MAFQRRSKVKGQLDAAAWGARAHSCGTDADVWIWHEAAGGIRPRALPWDLSKSKSPHSPPT